MTTEFLQKVSEARQEYLELPPESRTSFLEQLRQDDPGVATELERLLREGASGNPATVDFEPGERSDGIATVDSDTPSQPERTANIPENAGRYVFESKIAQGGMGAVYRVRDPQFDRTLAVKVMLPKAIQKPGARKRFLDEARITGQLQHPGIPPVHELGELEDGSPFFAMKLINGETLSKQLKERQSPSQELPKFLGIFGQICQTVAYAHSRGILHRDLKPSNVMVGAFGEVQVMDWGLAKFLSELVEESEIGPAEPRTIDSLQDGDLPGVSKTGDILGTPAYMAPEQARGEIHNLDLRTDVFGLGAILCEILTGAPAFRGKRQVDVLKLAARGDLEDAFARLEECQADRELISIAVKCLAKHPGDRFPNAAQVADAIEAYQREVQERLRAAELEKATAQTKAQEQGERLRVETAKRRVTLVLAVVVVLFVVAVGGAVAWYQSDRLKRMQEAHSRKLEKERRQAKERQQLELTAEEVRRAIREGTQIRKTLHAKLQQEGGVRAMYNRADVWKSQIDLGFAAVRRAKKLRDGAGERIDGTDSSLRQDIRDLEQGLQQDRKDYQLVKTFNRIRDDSLGTRNGEIRREDVLQKYPVAFREAGYDVLYTNPDGLVPRSRSSVIWQQFVVSLDDWASQDLLLTKEKKLYRKLLALTKKIDRDPLRNKLRDPELWRRPKEVNEMVRGYLSQPEKMKKLPAQTLVFIANMISTPSVRLAWESKAQLLQPTDFELAFFHAGTLYEAGKYAESEGYYKVAVANQPTNAAAWSNLGISLYVQEKYPAASDAFRKSLELDDKDQHIWVQLGRSYAKLRQYSKAIRIFQTLLETAPKNRDAWKRMGDAFCDKGEPIKAIAPYKKVIALKETSSAWDSLGSAWLRLNQPDKATEAYKKALALNPKNWGSLTRLGAILAEKKMYSKAIEKFEEVLRYNNKHKVAWFNLGLARFHQKDFEAAIEAQKAAIKLDPNYANALVNLGAAHLHRREYAKAEKVLSRAVKSQPKHIIGWRNLATALHAQKKYKQAIEAQKKALQFDPGSYRSHYGLALSLLRDGQFQQAISEFEKARRGAPAQHPIHGAIRQSRKIAQQCATLETHLPAVLAGRARATNQTQLHLIRLCVQYRKQYRNASRLYVVLFQQAPEYREDWQSGHRYNAACAAALAAAGQGAHAKKIDLTERSALRAQTRAWLHADLKVYHEALKKNRLMAPAIVDRMELWQDDPDLASVRDKKAIAKLSKDEQLTWTKLWDDVVALEKVARSHFTETKLQSKLKLGDEFAHKHKMTAGNTYIIEMVSKQFDTLLRLEDANENKLSENDDIAKNNRNSRIVFTPKKTGTYRIGATSFGNQGQGAYEIIIREFRSEDRKPENPGTMP